MMHATDMITMAVLFGIFQAVLVCFVFVNKKRFQQHKFLVLFIGALLIVQIHSFLVRSGLMSEVLFLFNTNVPFILLFGPLIYLYSIKQLSKEISKSALVLHLVPFVFYLGYSFNFFLQEEAFKYNILSEILQLDVPKREFVKTFAIDPWNIQGWVVVEFISFHLVSYGVLSFLVINKYRTASAKKLKKSQMQWVNYLSGMLLISGVVIFLSEGGVVNGQVFFESPFPSFSPDLFSTVAMYATSLYLIRKPEFLSAQIKKYDKSTLSKEFKKDKLKIVLNIMEKHKLYLDPNFSLDLLSRESGISKHHISQIINEQLNSTFFDLTNNYRIEEAKRLLAETEYVKMEQLAYQLGYRSKSSFFIAFKKATNLTPSKYLNPVVV